MASARETSCFGGSRLTFRDRCRILERLYVDVQISWQARCFGHGDGGGLWHALISCSGPRLLDMWLVSEIGGSLERRQAQCCVDLEVQIS